MAFTAQGLEAVRVEGVLARFALQGVYMIALKPTRPAALATPITVALEDGPADGGPVAGSQADVVLTHLAPRGMAKSVLRCCPWVEDVFPTTDCGCRLRRKHTFLLV